MSETVVLPGLGATGAMYQGPWRELAKARFLDWPKDSGIDSLDGLAEWVCEQAPQAKCFVGSSLGGMIALLCASKMKHKRVVLLGSAVDYAEVSTICQKLQPLSRALPFELAKLLSGSVPVRLAQMYAQQDASLMKGILTDIPKFKWRDDQVEVLRAHGEHDAVIECPAGVDLKLNGGHLIAMSHANEICQWLESLD